MYSKKAGQCCVKAHNDRVIHDISKLDANLIYLLFTDIYDFFIPRRAADGNRLRGDLKQFYIITSTIRAFVAMDFIHSGEFSPSH